MKRYSRYIFLTAVLVCLGLIPLLSLCAPVGSGQRQIEFRITPGISALHVAQKLKEHDLITNINFFRWYLRLSGLSEKIQIGSYELHDGMWMTEIAHALSSGKTKLNAITIPEGWNHRQIGDYLTAKGFLKDREEFLQLSRDPALLRKYRILDPSTEGYLYPETYMVPDYYPAARLHRLMLDTFFNVIGKLTAGKNHSLEELRQRIILASIVEREARHSKERPIIARVFLNRLQKRMKLESCATVQYLFEKPKAKLYLRDLARPSPYNTYLHYGMPPAPIANSGRAALQAAFDPQKNQYLYFVVKPDGTHHFSETYSEHISAKKKYIDSDLVVER